MQKHSCGGQRICRSGSWELNAYFWALLASAFTHETILPTLFLKSFKNPKPKWSAGVYEKARYAHNWTVRRKEKRDWQREIFEALMSKRSVADVNQKDAR